MYSERYMYHFQSPLHVGEMPDATAQAEVCYEKNGCMDKVSLYLKLDDGVISDARFRARGCSGTVAVCSAMCTLLVGQRIEAASELDPATLAIELGGIPQDKEHSLNLARKALTAAINRISPAKEIMANGPA